jgi:hypothetical protein
VEKASDLKKRNDIQQNFFPFVHVYLSSTIISIGPACRTK